ncbi:hypothetical protein [Methylobacter sp. S3L5C]|nr:hypothetical protein [Methylobacter sp. S3L5C]
MRMPSEMSVEQLAKWLDSLLWSLLSISPLWYVSARKQSTGKVGAA